MLNVPAWLALIAAAAIASLTAPLPIAHIRDVMLPGATTRFDYESIDAGRHRLYIAHLGDSEVLIFDTRHERVIGRVGGISNVHGVLAVPSLGLVYASATGTNEIVGIDEATGRIATRMPGGIYPDGLAYDPSAHLLFVSDETGGTDTVIDAQANKVVATITLGGEAGNTQFDSGSHRMFVAVQTRNELAEVDPVNRRIVARYPLPGCAHDHGLLIDADHRLAFVACDNNSRLLTFDLQSHRVTGSATVGADPDVLAFDPGLRRLYVAAESGVVAVFAETAHGAVTLGRGFLAPHAHVVAIDAATHRAYFPLQDVAGRPALRIVEAVRR